MKNSIMPLVNKKILQTNVLFVAIVMMTLALSHYFALDVNASTGDEVRAAKKIVSVVYDDSGSMQGERWSFANYSMQALIALMNEQDELYITFMSQPETSQEISLNSLQSSVNKIHDISNHRYTPELALDTAMSRLDSISENDPTTQFWYIVMTDGEIYDDLESDGNVIDIQRKLDSYKNKLMSNSSKLNIVYLGMVGASPVTGDPINNLYSYMPETDSDIVSAMRNISNVVSSRIVAESITRINSKEIKVTSELPLFNLSVLSQRSSAKIVKAKADEIDLNVQRNISLDATDLPNGSPLPDLYGNAGVINLIENGEQKVIAAGTYTITFSDEVDVNDIVVQFEPAIGFRTDIVCNGVAVGSLDELNYGDKVSIRLVPVIPGTDEEIPYETLPEGMKIDIEYKVDGNVVASSQTGELTDITIDEGNNRLRGTIIIPGFAPYISEESFEIVNIVYHFGIVVEEPDVYVPEGKKPENYEVSGVTYDRSCIKDIVFDDTNTVRFWIINDGKKLNSEEQSDINVSLEFVGMDFKPSQDSGLWGFLGSKLMKARLEQNADGSYSLVPEVPSFLPFMTLVIKDGTYTANVVVSRDNSVSNVGSFKILRNKAENSIPWIYILFLLFLLYLLGMIIFKKKFMHQHVFYERWSNNDGTGVLRDSDDFYLSSLPTLLLPTSACFKKRWGIVFLAETDGGVYITGKSIAQTYEYYGYGFGDPESDIYSISEGLFCSIKENGVREANDMPLGTNPVYFKYTSESSELIRIWINDD